MQYQVPEPTPKQAKITMYLIFTAYCGLIPLLWFVAAMAKKEGQPLASSLYLAYGAGAVALVTAAIFANTKLQPSSQVGDVEVVDLKKFQTLVLTSLAISEFALILGVVLLLGYPAAVAPSAIGTLVVNLGVILPRINVYWQVYEQANGPL